MLNQSILHFLLVVICFPNSLLELKQEGMHVSSTICVYSKKPYVYHDMHQPNIVQAMGAVNKCMANPKIDHWNVAKQILCYVRGTPAK